MKRLAYLMISAVMVQGAIPHAALATPSEKMQSKPVPWAAEHTEAVRLARAGDVKKALGMLNQLYGKYPQDAKIAQDYMVVANWAGQHSDALMIYSTLPETNQPSYVLLAAARSSRSMKQLDEALALFDKGLARLPADAGFAEGKILTLVDMNQPGNALELGRTNLKTYGDRVDVLLASAHAARKAKLPIEALRYSQKAVKIAPENRAVKRDLVESLGYAGAPEVALFVSDSTPDLLTPKEVRALQGDVNASIVRVETLDPFREPERFSHTDRAIADYDKKIAQWTTQGDATRNDVLRMRFDRMVALRDRVRMKDVLAEYDDLRKQDVTLPIYALNTAGDAYLYTRQPEKALEIYSQVLKASPKDFNARMAIFYTYIELDRYEDAYKQIDELVKEEPKWIYLKGLKDPLASPERAAAELAAGLARMYGNQHAEAEKRLTPIAEAAPANSHHKAALGAIYENRGLPRKAQEEYQLGKALQRGQDLQNEAGEARTDLALQNFLKSEKETADLYQRFPENLEIQKLKRDWDIHNMNELNVRVGRGLHSTGSATGDRGINVDTQFYSKPVDYNWRIMAGHYYAHETEPNDEGKITYNRASIGAEYRGHGVTASLTPTYNTYKGNGRAGGRADASYSRNDNWSHGGSAEIFSRDTPLRALNSGVRANNVEVNTTYQKNESQQVTVGAGYMAFSDGNRRLNLSGMVSQRLYTSPTLKIDGVADSGFSSNSKDQNRLYYNPERDVMTHLGMSATHTIYRRYEFLWQHNLKLMPGYYWEKNYGSSPAFTAHYEHMLTLNDVMRISFGAHYVRQDYDGETENNLSLLGNLNYRF